MAESYQKKLKRVRPPSVKIEYEVETEGATIVKELPFVVGVMGDFSDDPTGELKPLKDRSFLEIDRDNFNGIMARMTPGLNLRVDNTMKDDGSEMAVQLKFEQIEDFEPANVAKQVEPLKKLLETRENLRDLLAKIDNSDKLEQILDNVLANTEEMKSIASELGVESSGDDSDGGESS